MANEQGVLVELSEEVDKFVRDRLTQGVVIGGSKDAADIAAAKADAAFDSAVAGIAPAAPTRASGGLALRADTLVSITQPLRPPTRRP